MSNRNTGLLKEIFLKTATYLTPGPTIHFIMDTLHLTQEYSINYNTIYLQRKSEDLEVLNGTQPSDVEWFQQN